MVNEKTYLTNLRRGPYEGPHFESDSSAKYDYTRDSNQYTLFRLVREYYNTNEDNFYGKKIQETLAKQIECIADNLRVDIKNGYIDNPDLPSSKISLRDADEIIKKHQKSVELGEM